MFRRKKSVNKKLLERKLYLAREDPEPVFDVSGCDLSEVPSGIYSLCKVFLKQTVNLSKNQLTSLDGGGNLADLSNIVCLILTSNQFQCLPHEIALLNQLKELYVDDNQLKLLPDSICQLTNLQVLTLRNNRLKSLPSNIGNLRKLHRFELVGNQLSELPKSLGRASTLTLLTVDVDNFVYPPKAIIQRGVKAVIDHLCKDLGVESLWESSDKVVEESGISDSFETKLQQLELSKINRQERFLAAERERQEAEMELASVHQGHKDKLLETITNQSNQFDEELKKCQQQRQLHQFQLLERLQEEENSASICIDNLLKLKNVAQIHYLDDENLLATTNNLNQPVMDKEKILNQMVKDLQNELKIFNKFDETRRGMSKELLERELYEDQKLQFSIKSQQLSRMDLVATIQEDSNLQKVAVGALLERADAHSWSLQQQLRLVEAQLAALTHIELDKRKLRVNDHLMDLCERRQNLSSLLTDLLDQQEVRKKQLITSLESLEDQGTDEEFWLKQYENLLKKLPQSILDAQRNINPKLMELLVNHGVLHCLPFLAKLQFKNITKEQLNIVGIPLEEQERILKVVETYKNTLLPSAPPMEEDEPSAPPFEGEIFTTTINCVVCFNPHCHIIFVPCGHLCCCSDCAKVLTTCPLCRSDINRKVVSF